MDSEQRQHLLSAWNKIAKLGSWGEFDISETLAIQEALTQVLGERPPYEPVARTFLTGFIDEQAADLRECRRNHRGARFPRLQRR